jgi:GT2 family glycosyltransferase
MSQNPLVTVICLCYNHADYVVESLNSVINQDYKNIELMKFLLKNLKIDLKLKNNGSFIFFKKIF